MVEPTRELVKLPASDGPAVLAALIAALRGGPALHISAEASPAPLELLPDRVPAEVALLVASSGSSGVPKLVALSADALLASARASSERIGTGSWLAALPLNYIAGSNILMRALQAGQQPVFMNLTVGFTPEGFARAASLLPAGPRYTSLVPSQLDRLLSAAELDDFVLGELRSFTRILLGGQLVPEDLVSRANGMGLAITESYGLTETGGGVIFDGVPLAGTEARIQSGLLQLRTGSLAQGYLDSKGQVTPLELADGWFLTSDLAEHDALGGIRLLGRSDRSFVSGGLKLSLDLLEARAAELCGECRPLAVAVSDERWGERPVLFVTAGEGAPHKRLAESLRKEFGDVVAKLRIAELEEIPYLSSGKVDYERLNRLAERVATSE